MSTPLSEAGQLRPGSQSDAHMSIEEKLHDNARCGSRARRCPLRTTVARDCRRPAGPAPPQPGLTCQSPRPAEHPLASGFQVSNQPSASALESWAVCLAPLEGGEAAERTGILEPSQLLAETKHDRFTIGQAVPFII